MIVKMNANIQRVYVWKAWDPLSLILHFYFLNVYILIFHIARVMNELYLLDNFS